MEFLVLSREAPTGRAVSLVSLENGFSAEEKTQGNHQVFGSHGKPVGARQNKRGPAHGDRCDGRAKALGTVPAEIQPTEQSYGQLRGVNGDRAENEARGMQAVAPGEDGHLLRQLIPTDLVLWCPSQRSGGESRSNSWDQESQFTTLRCLRDFKTWHSGEMPLSHCHH